MRNFFKNISGYTLIEMLAVIFVVVTVGTIITGIIVVSLRDSNRSVNVNEVRQAGNFVLAQMVKNINYSKSFEGLAKDKVFENGGVILRSYKSCLTTDTYKYLKIKSFDNSETTYICGSSTDQKLYKSDTTGWKEADINSSLTAIIDPDPTTGFTVSACSFTCSQTNLSVSPTITIDFTVTKATSSLFVENKVSIPFQTTIGIKNYSNQP